MNALVASSVGTMLGLAGVPLMYRCGVASEERAGGLDWACDFDVPNPPPAIQRQIRADLLGRGGLVLAEPGFVSVLLEWNVV